VISEQIRQVEAQLNQMESVALPKGMGTVLFQQTEREVGDWGRLRHMLIECTWLLIRWNSDYRGVQKWREKLLDAKLTRSSKKKIVVVIVRQFAVDWWRVRTGRVKPEDIGLSMKLIQP